MTIGCVQPGTRRGTFLQMIGSRKIVPPMMLRSVPFGDFHICFRPNSSTRCSSGVMVAHLTPTPYSLMAFAASTVIWRSEEHTSELQSLMRISYAVFCLKKKKKHNHDRQRTS